MTALNIFHHWDALGKCIFSFTDLCILFPNESHKTLKESVIRLVNGGILERLRKGLYLFVYTRHKNSELIEKIVHALRPGHYNYISLESALSQYGVISQMPIDRLTIMTTGTKGEYATPYGVIEFTHTNRSIIDIIKSTLQTNRPLKIAKKEIAYRDLKRVGRNCHLIDLVELANNE